MTQSTRPQRWQRGFTLVEILVVIAIIGLLAVIIAPNLMGHLHDSERKKAQVDLQALNDAAQVFHIKNHRWPTLRELAVPDVDGHAAISYHRDPWDHDYVLRGEGSGPLVLLSPGPDGIEGTEDDVVPPPPELPR